MIKYDPGLKEEARRLRAKMTDSDRSGSARLRRKQVHSVQFTHRSLLATTLLTSMLQRLRAKSPLTPLFQRELHTCLTLPLDIHTSSVYTMSNINGGTI